MAENKLFSKFNIYDQIGYLMVGAIFLLVFIFNLFYFFHINIPQFNLDNFLAWLVIVYFLGHVVQGIANMINELKVLNFLIPEKKEEYSEEDIEMLQQAREYFGLEKQDEKGLWNLCYMLTSAKDITGQIQSFNAYYSLYRGWFIAFIMESIFLLSYFLILSRDIFSLICLIVSIILCFIFYKRSKRFFSYLRTKVLQSFIIIKKLKL